MSRHSISQPTIISTSLEKEQIRPKVLRFLQHAATVGYFRPVRGLVCVRVKPLSLLTTDQTILPVFKCLISLSAASVLHMFNTSPLCHFTRVRKLLLQSYLCVDLFGLILTLLLNTIGTFLPCSILIFSLVFSKCILKYHYLRYA